jgi:hypothetical protein
MLQSGSKRKGKRKIIKGDQVGVRYNKFIKKWGENLKEGHH